MQRQPGRMAAAAVRTSRLMYRSCSSVSLDPKWTEAATKQLKGKDPKKLVWNTAEGIPIKPLYTRYLLLLGVVAPAAAAPAPAHVAPAPSPPRC